MRDVIVFLVLFILPGAALAQFEFLTVKEIFQTINFMAAHPETPANYITISPFGPELDETRMPETLADVAKSILHCYHHTARFQRADVAQAPWDHEGQRSDEDHSALIRIRYFGASSDDPYELNVGLVSRRNQIRAIVVNDSSPVARDADCQLDNWTTLRP